MPKETAVRLGEHFDDFIARQVSQERYAGADEVIRAGLRLLEAQEERLAALRSALVEGEESGAATPFDFDEFVADMSKHATPRA